MRSRARPVVLAALALLASVPAGAQDRGVAAGRRLYLEARFPEAERAFEESTRDVSSTRSDLVDAYRHLAVLKLAGADRAGAYAAALAAVSLRWSVVPPEGVPPEAFELFEEARSRVPRSGLTAVLELRPSPIAGSGVSAFARVTGDLAELAAAVEVGCGGGRQRARRQLERDGDGVAQVRLTVASADGADRCVMFVLSQVGVVLAHASATAHATGHRAAGDRGGRAASGKFPLVLVGVGAALVVATATIVLIAASGDAGADLGPPELRWINE